MCVCVCVWLGEGTHKFATNQFLASFAPNVLKRDFPNREAPFENGGGRVVRWCWVNFQCRGVLQFGYSRARAYCARSRCEWGLFGHFTLLYPFSPPSPSLWKTARYRLKHCLKGPLNTKQPTNQLFENKILSLLCNSLKSERFSCLRQFTKTPRQIFTVGPLPKPKNSNFGRYIFRSTKILF